MKSFSGQKLLKSLIQKHAINANTEFCFPATFQGKRIKIAKTGEKEIIGGKATNSKDRCSEYH